MASHNVTRLAFGLVPGSLDGEALAAFDALASWIRAHAEVTLERNVAPDYRTLAASVRAGKSDVAWLPPVVYAWLAEAVTPLGSIVREGRTTYAAALVVREDSSVHAVADLKDTRVAWVDPWSAAGFVVPCIELARAGIDPAGTFRSQTFHGTHREALLALRRGDCDVAATHARLPADGGATLEGAWSSVEDLRVRVVATFGTIPTDVLAVRRNLPETARGVALGIFRDACTDPAARPLLHAAFGGDSLREGVEPGHDALRHAFEQAVANGLFD
jgi:phosphate/phosphite/phosphonate ABC transporter binding protein